MPRIPHSLTPRRGARLMLVLVALLLAVAACVDEDDDRRFANDPLPVEDRPTILPSPPDVATVPPATPGPALASPEAVLVAHGAPDRIFFLAGDELWTIAASGRDAQRVFAPNESGEIIAAFAPSPAADLVAILLVPTESASSSKRLLILEADGTVAREINFDPADDASAGEHHDPPLHLDNQLSLDWSPDGDRLLFAFSGGGLFAVPVDNDSEPKLLIDAERMSSLTKAAWSPAGDAVAFLSPDESTVDIRLFVAPAGAPPLDPVAVAPSPEIEGRSVTGMARIPDGSGILFTEDATAAGTTMGGDLFMASSSGADRKLVASAGRAAPVADVVAFAPSPDARAVAYTVFLPGSGGSVFHSLWVQPIGSAEAMRMPAPAGQTVTDLWWTANGLVWRSLADAPPGTIAYDHAAFSLYQIDASGDPVFLFEYEPVPAATPDASPAASPVASPAATPLASPVASPSLD